MGRRLEETPSTGRAFDGNIVPPSPVAGQVRRAASVRFGERSLPAPRRVVDQTDLNCCVSCTLAAAMEISNTRWSALAPLFHYYVARFQRAGAADARGGLYLDRALSVLQSDGICSDTDHPTELPGVFTNEDAGRRPSPRAYRRGREQRLRRLGRRPGYKRIDAAGSRFVKIRELINKGRPVIIGLKLPGTYPDRFLDSRCRWLDPTQLGNRFYRHCVVVTGYSDAEGALRVQDSRGPQAFDRGSWWLGRQVVDSPAVEEVYALRL